MFYLFLIVTIKDVIRFMMNINLNKKWGIIISILILNIDIFSQVQKNSSLLLGGHLNKGFIMKHSKKMEGLTSTYPFGLNIFLHWQRWDEQSWQYCYCYPRIGLIFHYINYLNPVLGEAYALFPFLEPVLKAEKKVHLSMSFGIGPAYVAKIYDSITNPRNICFSSHISFIVYGSGNLFLSINRNLEFKFSLSLNHISNGGISKPNLGVNYILLSTGLNYHFSPMEYPKERIKAKNPLVDYKNRYDVLMLFTAKTVDRGYERYPGVGVNLGFSKVISRMNALSLNFEFMNDISDKKYIEKNNLLDKDKKLLDHKYFSFMGGHELLLGRFVFYQQIGFYIYSPYKRRDPLYQRYGLNYYINKKFFIGINLKAHREVADFLDFRIGFSKKI